MLSVYTIDQSEQWDRIVTSFREHDAYYLSGYVKAFHLHGDGEPLLIHYEGTDIRGIQVVMRRDVADLSVFSGTLEKNTYFDLTTPYGYGGWIIEGDDRQALFCAYETWAKENNIVCEFVRFHPVLQNHMGLAPWYQVIELGSVIELPLDTPELIWSNITSKNRNMIRKAQKNDIQIRNERSACVYQTFRKIYNETMQKDQADAYYYFSEAFYDSLREDLPEHAQVFYAVKQEQIIAAAIMLHCNGRMNYHLSGSVREYAGLAPTNLLLYEAACWGSANGYQTLYLGGGVGSKEDNLFKFKKSFYRQDDLKHFYIGKKILDAQAYERLVELRGPVQNQGFFPQYRAKE